MHDNLAQAGLEGKVDINEINRHAGMQALEPFWIWKRSDADVMRHVRWDDAECDAVREALAAGCSIVFMTPHVGCYEVTPIWLYDTCLKLFDKKMTVLYREPKVKFIRAAVANGRMGGDGSGAGGSCWSAKDFACHALGRHIGLFA